MNNIEFVNIYVKKENGEYNIEDIAKYQDKYTGIIPVFSGFEIVGFDENDKAFLMNEKGEIVGETNGNRDWSDIYADGNSFEEAIQSLVDILNEYYGIWEYVGETRWEPGENICTGMRYE